MRSWRSASLGWSVRMQQNPTMENQCGGGKRLKHPVLRRDELYRLCTRDNARNELKTCVLSVLVLISKSPMRQSVIFIISI